MIEIDKLEAGPELDALVAEKVMELKVDGWFPVQQDEVGGLDALDDDEPVGLFGKRPCYRTCGDHPSTIQYEHGSTCRSVVPEYSQDIAAAWQVGLKLGDFTIERWCGDNRVPEHWTCTLRNPKTHPGHRIIKAMGATAPLAICRAALKALDEP